jgi:pyruvate formate lyase activating enzyme
MSDECLNEVIPYLDAVNVDLKSIEEKFYLYNCGGKVTAILDNLKKLKNEQIHVEITTLIIPTLSDEIEMLEKIANFIATELGVETPWHISKFSPNISWKLKNLRPTDDDIIYEAYEIGKEAGLKYVYVGNLPGDDKENTYCPGCGELVIRRFGYEIERYDQDGHCQNCDKFLDIVD